MKHTKKTKQTSPELLAPAGSPEALLAALRCGADAVYLGGVEFNARSTAQNFAREEMIAAGKACGKRGVKFYFALNTMLADSELPQALLLAQEAVAAGAAAIIVQDLGLMALLQQHGLRVHASTQCAVQSKWGMALLQQLGCSRVVLPRELAKEEISALVQDAPMELEAFVHGAHCVSLSGQCLMSVAFGGRSGNRGNCAQPCRLAWNGEQASPIDHALSLKDLSLLDHVNEAPLNQLAALKIEGRQKRPEYVAAAVSAFRGKLDERAEEPRGLNNHPVAAGDSRRSRHDRREPTGNDHPTPAGVPLHGGELGVGAKELCGSQTTPTAPAGYLPQGGGNDQQRCGGGCAPREVGDRPANHLLQARGAPAPSARRSHRDLTAKWQTATTCGEGSQGSRTAYFSQPSGASTNIVTEAELREAFSRSGFTQGYFQNARGQGMFGVRQKEDLATTELLKKMRGLYEKEAATVPLDIKFVGQIGQPTQLTVTALGHSVTVQGDVLVQAQAQPLSEAALRKQLCKLGGTVYYAGEVEVLLEAGGFLAVSAVNALRRKAVEAMEQCAIQEIVAPQMTTPLLRKPSSTRGNGEPVLYLRFGSHKQVPENLPVGAKVFLPCETAPALLRQHDAQVTVPTGIFGASEDVLAQLRAAKEVGVREAMAHTLDGIALALEAGLTPVAGEGMNLCNSESLAAVARLGTGSAVVSAEITPGQLRGLRHEILRGAMVYGKLRLMVIRNDWLLGLGDRLIDRKGMRFPMMRRGDCVEVYNSRPIWLCDVKEKLPKMDFVLMSFVTEDKEECAQVLRAWELGRKCAGEFTRGWGR